MFAPLNSKLKKPSAITYRPKWYHLETIKQLITMAAAAVFSVPGTGKTMCMLSAFLLMRKAGKADKMLVIAKRRIIHNVWPKEIAKWDTTKDLRIAMVHGPKKAEALASDADVYLMNYEGIKWLTGYTKLINGKRVRIPGQPKKLREQFDVICLDESTMIKNWSAQRTRCLKKILASCKRRYILSGTPTPNSMIDIFSQIYMLDMGDTLGTSIVRFRNMYFYPSGFGGYYFKLQEGAEERIYDAIDHLVIRYGDDVLDLEPYIPVERPFTLPPKARKIYREMEEEFITDIEKEGIVYAVNSGVAQNKCRQICTGAVYQGKGKHRKVIHVHDEKVEELQTLIEELRGRPCLVAYEYDHERERIQKAMKNVPHIGGGVTDKEARKLEDNWNAGKIPVLLAQPDSVAHGLNLQENGGVICFFSTGWNYENHDQLRRRLWRTGYEGTLFVYYILAEDTVEEAVVLALKEKENSQQRLLESLQQRYGVRVMNRTNKPKLTFKGKAPNAAHVVKCFVDILKREGTKVPQYDHRDKDAERADYNFCFGLSQIFSGWLPRLHAEFLNNVYGKAMKADKDSRLDKLFTATSIALMNALGVTETDDSRCYVVDDRSAMLKLWPTIKATKESTMATSKSKFGGSSKKVSKKAASKKKAPAKKAAKKTAAKKAPSKKQVAKSAKQATQRDALTKLLTRKSGCSITEASEKMDVSEPNVRSIIGALRKAGTKVKSQGNGVFKI